VYQEDAPGPWLTVVGVSGAAVQQLGEQRPDPVMFRPHRPATPGSMVILMRTARDPAALTGALRSGVHQLDPDLALANVMTLAQRVEQQTWFLGVFGSLFSVFAFAALLMAGVGIYAVVAHTTGRRTQEIGVRVALGATSFSILRLVLTRGLIQLGIGLVLGLGAAFGVTRFMSAVLFSVSSTDPVVFASVSVVLVCVGLLACWLPARRAAAMPPTRALRNE
jgi:ABC-type antimicrobial peptide transport system permease subunit